MRHQRSFKRLMGDSSYQKEHMEQISDTQQQVSNQRLNVESNGGYDSFTEEMASCSLYFVDTYYQFDQCSRIDAFCQGFDLHNSSSCHCYFDLYGSRAILGRYLTEPLREQECYHWDADSLSFSEAVINLKVHELIG